MFKVNYIPAVENSTGKKKINGKGIHKPKAQTVGAYPGWSP